jgi:prepilin-type N-terminal cleavage/methylation domain-containing protein
MRHWLKNERGFTMAELLVATAVAGLVMAGVFLVLRGGQQAYLLGSSRVETQQNARVALDLMTRELRSATSITLIPGTTDITFQDQTTPTPKTIRYALAGTTLNRTEDGTTTALIGSVQALAMTYYRVYDVYNATYTTTTDPGQVKVIKISLIIKTEASVATGSPGDQRATMESTVLLRATLS